ncbi:MAG: 16S rRNA (cytosine(1402)-N(4))-methyltransferase, partial [Lachnospiraceae bacterium]|nr:16S rRNA (cytosine(1402)-N(4))-methyltransferase [Lachnospiraceae bacterium]
MEFKHTSVLLQETIENLDIKPEGIYLDGTLGGGGHAGEVAARLTGAGRLIGIDQDEDAIAAAGKRLLPYQERVTLIRDNYVHAVEALSQIGVSQVDGIVLDLGVS